MPQSTLAATLLREPALISSAERRAALERACHAIQALGLYEPSVTAEPDREDHLLLELDHWIGVVARYGRRRRVLRLPTAEGTEPLDLPGTLAAALGPSLAPLVLPRLSVSLATG